MGDQDGKKKPPFDMPPPPKPLSFEMPKPPVLQPNIASLLQKTNTTGEDVKSKDAQPSVTPVPPPTFNPVPNPFAPRPKSVSPNPHPDVPAVTVGALSAPADKSETEGEKIEKPSETAQAHVENVKKPEKPSSLGTHPLTTEIPITPMVEEAKPITSPAVVEVSSHAESVKSSIDSSNLFTDKVDMSGGLMSWLTKTVTESKLLSDVAGKAKAGVETVMTTLDPGMKPFLAEHGVIEFALFNCDADLLTVASDAFTKSGAMAICRGLTSVIANFRPLVAGEEKARKMCEIKVEAARKTNKAKEDAAVVVIQPFLMEISGRYYSTCKIVLHHESKYFDAISQLLEIPSTLVEVIQRAAKSEGLPDDEFSTSVTQAIKNVYKTSVTTWEPGSFAPYDSKELLSIQMIDRSAHFCYARLHFKSMNIRTLMGVFDVYNTEHNIVYQTPDQRYFNVRFYSNELQITKSGYKFHYY